MWLKYFWSVFWNFFWMNECEFLLSILIKCRYPNLPGVSGQQQLQGGHVQVPESLVSFSPVDCLNSDGLQSTLNFCCLETQQWGVTLRQLLTHTHKKKCECEWKILSVFSPQLTCMCCCPGWLRSFVYGGFQRWIFSCFSWFFSFATRFSSAIVWTLELAVHKLRLQRRQPTSVSLTR